MEQLYLRFFEPSLKRNNNRRNNYRPTNQYQQKNRESSEDPCFKLNLITQTYQALHKQTTRCEKKK